jgi:hypothetical protein
MGGVIMQEGRPVAYFSKKLNGAQKNYTTMEKEMLAIVMTLKEFRTMLYGAEISIYTDHKNLTFNELNTQRVQRWRAFVEEYSPKLLYVPGEKNILADTFSPLPRRDDETNCEAVEIENAYMNESLEDHYSLLEDQELFDCFLNLPELDNPEENPLNYSHIRDRQQSCSKLTRTRDMQPDRYFEKELEDGINIICYAKTPNDKEENWKIALPDNMVEETVEWFHLVMGHPGRSRLRDFLQSRYHNTNLRRVIDHHKCENTASGTSYQVRDTVCSQNKKFDQRHLKKLPST